jgi:hypothetical protein
MASGGGSQPTQQTVTQTNLPEYARPYFEGMMQRSQSLLTQPYTPYGQERLAGFTPEQQQVQQNILGQQAPGEFGTAEGLTTAAGLGSLQAGQYDPTRFRAQMVGQPNLQQFQMQGAENFGVPQAQQYMSPFMEQAIAPQLRSAVSDARRAQITQDLGAARQGTYGGSRQLLASLEREDDLADRMGDIRARGLQSAFENAQMQFERDRAAQMGVGRENLAAALGTQQLGTQTGLQALLANQQTGLEAQRLGEQSRQFGAQQRLAGLGQAGQMGQTLTNIGSARSQADQARLGMQSQTAAQQQALQQQYMDMAYQDFLRQRDFPLEMLQQYSSLLRGVPVAPASTQTSYAPAPSMASQVLGTGLGALGIARTLGG